MRVTAEAWLPADDLVLEEAALEAIRESSRNLLVSAGPGAGKTEFLAQKADYLLRTGTCRAGILAISFKKDSASNLKKRVELRHPKGAARFRSITLDAFAKSIVDQFLPAIPEMIRPNRDYNLENTFPDQNTERSIKQFFQESCNIIDLERLGADNPAAYQIITSGDFKLNQTYVTRNRLAEYLIRNDSRIRKALRAAYPYVFLDEFQDTTGPQYQLICTAFNDSECQLTAVGDLDQAIMRWAGADVKIFDQFKDDFNASECCLIENHRSVDNIKLFLRDVRGIIRGAGGGERELTSDKNGVLYIKTDDPYHVVAECVEKASREYNVAPEDIAVLCRKGVGDIFDKLRNSITNVRFRNTAEKVNGVEVQEILNSPMTKKLMTFLRSAQDKKMVSEAREAMHHLFECDEDDYKEIQKADNRLRSLMGELKKLVNNSPPSVNSIDEAWNICINNLGHDILIRLSPEYQQQKNYERAYNALISLLKNTAEGRDSWSDILDEFEGVGQIPVMTIHKSKGLEFDTVFVFGVDNTNWNALSNKPTEELNTFYVAASRAKTRCYLIGGSYIQWIKELPNLYKSA